MVEFDLPQPLPADFIALIPEQRAMINQLLEEQKVLMYSLAADRSKVWAIMNAKDEIEVMNVLADMPLIQYSDPIVTELAFHNSVRFAFPAISLN